MSFVRLAGVAISIIGFLICFFVFRGARWKKANFVLGATLSIGLFCVSIWPGILTIPRDLLSLGDAEYGRMLSLVVGSCMGLWVFVVYLKAKLDDERHQFDLLVRALAVRDVEHIERHRELLKEVMVIIPAYNEAENLKQLLPRIPREVDGHALGVLVVDDGSCDGTYEVAVEHGCLAVRNIINRGQGGASRAGYDILREFEVHYGVTMDADNQHRPEEIERLVGPVLRGEYDLVLGSRILGNYERGSALRQFGIGFFTRIINLLSGLKVTDCSSGFKAFDIKEMGRVILRENQFQSAEVIISAAKSGMRIGEVPITVNHRLEGESKKGTDLTYGYNFAKTIVKSWLR